MSELLPKSIMQHIPSTSNIVGITISSFIYSTITTTGDITASATKTGIDIAGNILGYGTDLVAGPIAGSTVRCLANSYGSVTKHTISKSSRIGAIGISLIAYTGSALTTTAIIHGSNILANSYNYFFTPAPISVEMIVMNKESEPTTEHIE